MKVASKVSKSAVLRAALRVEELDKLQAVRSDCERVEKLDSRWADD